jgi:rhodanese-related sulfurtransferase
MSLTSALPKEIQQINQQGALIVDIRERDEFCREHIPDAISLPLSEILAGAKLAGSSPAQPVIFHCQAGSRTRQNADALTRLAEPARVILMDGGINAWNQAGLPTVKVSKQPLPLMRQVQIAAGSLILAGVIAGYSISPGFFLLPAFVGAGLTFAGISGWCGMAILLEKMPWNRR